MLKGAPAEAWCAVAVDGARGEHRWLGVFEHQAHTGIKHRFGLLDDGGWCALSADGARVSAPGNLIPFLPLLERPWAEITSGVVSAVRALGMADTLAWSFPLDEVLVAGLESSEYWRAKAEQWISSDYPLTDAIAALTPRHPRSRARHRERMASLFGLDNAPLREELEAAEGSFLIKLRVELEWDKDAFNRLTQAMYRYVRERDHETAVPLWIAHGFWFLDGWVKDWSSHEGFPRPHGDAYYEAAYERLNSLAFWLFAGTPAHEGDEAYAPL